jgi:hypothetical protein
LSSRFQLGERNPKNSLKLRDAGQPMLADAIRNNQMDTIQQQAAMTRAAFLILTENAERASPHTGSLRTFATPPVRCDCESELKMEIPVEADKTVRQ